MERSTEKSISIDAMVLDESATETPSVGGSAAGPGDKVSLNSEPPSAGGGSEEEP